MFVRLKAEEKFEWMTNSSFPSNPIHIAGNTRRIWVKTNSQEFYSMTCLVWFIAVLSSEDSIDMLLSWTKNL